MRTEHRRQCGRHCLGPMTFHTEVRGQQVTLSEGARRASTLSHGLAFICRTVQAHERIHLRVEPSVGGALRVGFTNVQPGMKPIPPTTFPDLENERAYCVALVPEAACRANSEIQFWVNYAGFLLIRGTDGKKYYMKSRLNVDDPLWALIDIYGNTTAVCLLGSEKRNFFSIRTSCPVPEVHSTPDKNFSIAAFSNRKKSRREGEEYQRSPLLLPFWRQTKGTPAHELPGGDHEKSFVNLNWTHSELSDFICSSYPLVNLRDHGFHIAQADKHGGLVRIHCTTMKALKEQSSQNQLFIIPETDITFASEDIDGHCPPTSPAFPSAATDGRGGNDPTSTGHKSPSDVVCLLRRFRHRHLDFDEEVNVVVWRKRLLKSAWSFLSKNNFPWMKIPRIEFVGEEAFDHGGPKREFFRLLMIEVQTSLGVFEGKPGHLLFTYDQMALDQGKYLQAGKLVAWTLLHGGPGMKALEPCLYQLMCGQEAQLGDFDWNLIPDPDIQVKVQKILQCKSTKDLHNLQRDQGDWICECGFLGIYCANISIDDVPKIYSCVVRHYAYLRTSSMIDQFTEGLNSIGKFWSVVKANWLEFLPIFCRLEGPISRATFRNLFHISWSRTGSRNREKEKETIYYWELVLHLIQNKETSLNFKELLVFVTGAEEVLCIPQRPTICFYNQEKNGCCRLPYASTCSMTLYLPRGIRDEQELMDMLLRALRDSEGFSKA